MQFYGRLLFINLLTDYSRMNALGFPPIEGARNTQLGSPPGEYSAHSLRL